MKINLILILTNLISISVSFTVPNKNSIPGINRQSSFSNTHQEKCQNKALPPTLKSSTVANMDDGEELPESGGTATMSSLIFNLVKNIVGAGVLSLPSGIAAFANAPSAVIPAVYLISSIGIASSYCFSLIGRVCSY